MTEEPRETSEPEPEPEPETEPETEPEPETETETETEPESESEAGSDELSADERAKLRRREIVFYSIIGLAVLALLSWLVFAVWPRSLYREGKKLTKQTNERLADGKDGFVQARRARIVLSRLKRFPGWKQRALKELSRLPGAVGNGMAIAEHHAAPPGALKERAVRYIVKHLAEGDSRSREMAEGYLYRAGFLEELNTAGVKAGWHPAREHILRALLHTGQLKTLLRGLKGHRRSILDEHYHSDLFSAERVACLLGNYGPAVRRLQARDTRPLPRFGTPKGAPVKVDLAIPKDLSKFLAGVKTGSDPHLSRKLFLEEQHIVDIECALRARKLGLAQKGIARLVRFVRNARYTVLFLQARLHLLAGRPADALRTLNFEPLRKPHGIGLWSFYSPLPAFQLKLVLLARAGRYDELLRTAKQLRYYWNAPTRPRYFLMILFQHGWYQNPGRWEELAGILAKVKPEHPQAAALGKLREAATLAAAQIYVSRGTPRALKLLGAAKDRKKVADLETLYRRLWKGEPWPLPVLLNELTEKGPKLPPFRPGDSGALGAMPSALRVYETLMRSKLTPMQKGHELQRVRLNRSIEIGTLLYRLSAQVKYGRKLKAKRVAHWERTLKAWQDILRSQPNQLLLATQKI